MPLRLIEVVVGGRHSLTANGLGRDRENRKLQQQQCASNLKCDTGKKVCSSLLRIDCRAAPHRETPTQTHTRDLSLIGESITGRDVCISSCATYDGRGNCTVADIELRELVFQSIEMEN